MIYESITDLIGNTPLLKIPESLHRLPNVDLYAKLEMMNPFGSVKDRIAWGIIKDDIEEIRRSKRVIYENSSGNTAKALQVIASIHGVRTKLITYLARVDGVKDIIRLLGAEIEEVLGGSECFDPNDPNDPQFLIERAVKENPEQAYFPSQFTNPRNPEVHYATTGKEIQNDLGHVDYFFGGLGTSGSTLGVARRLRETSPSLKAIGICASKNDFIPGIRSLDQMWESGLFTRENYADFVYVDSGESVDAMMELVRGAGVLCGPTSGASYRGTVQYLSAIAHTFKSRKTAVFIVCDRLEWYMDYIRARRPHLFAQPIKPGSLREFSESESTHSPEISLEVAREMLESDGKSGNIITVDVRSNLAYRLGSIPGSLNVPWELFEQLIDGSQPFPSGARVLLVCPEGERTKRYAKYLTSRGYEAYTMCGGIIAWRNAGYPLTSRN